MITDPRSTETVWDDNGLRDGYDAGRRDQWGKGGGCSLLYAARACQTHTSDRADTDCGSERLPADISTVADPFTGFDVPR